MRRLHQYDAVDSSPRASFGTTQWSLDLAARDRTAPEAREALAALCQPYWYPLYAFVRRKGYDCDRAQDLGAAPQTGSLPLGSAEGIMQRL